jgi:hypothetical protein
MNHNQFDYYNDLIIPLKDFLKRNTGLKPEESANISIPGSLYEIPPCIKENIINVIYKNKSSFYNCFGVYLDDLENEKTK